MLYLASLEIIRLMQPLKLILFGVIFSNNADLCEDIDRKNNNS